MTLLVLCLNAVFYQPFQVTGKFSQCQPHWARCEWYITCRVLYCHGTSSAWFFSYVYCCLKHSLSNSSMDAILLKYSWMIWVSSRTMTLMLTGPCPFPFWLLYKLEVESLCALWGASESSHWQPTVLSGYLMTLASSLYCQGIWWLASSSWFPRDP